MYILKYLPQPATNLDDKFIELPPLVYLTLEKTNELLMIMAELIPPKSKTAKPIIKVEEQMSLGHSIIIINVFR